MCAASRSPNVGQIEQRFPWMDKVEAEMRCRVEVSAVSSLLMSWSAGSSLTSAKDAVIRNTVVAIVYIFTAYRSHVITGGTPPSQYHKLPEDTMIRTVHFVPSDHPPFASALSPTSPDRILQLSFPSARTRDNGRVFRSESSLPCLVCRPRRRCYS